MTVVEVAVGAIAVRDGALLLVERGRDPDAGKWSLPGGRVEPGEHLSKAVEREVREETGLVVRCGPLVGWAERISERYHFVIFDFSVELTSSDSPIAGDDARAVRWVPLDEVASIELAGGLREFLVNHQVVR